MSDALRTFIAISLPENIKKALDKAESVLKKADADVKWVKPDNIHLTLKFLGNVDKAIINRIKNILNNTAKKYEVFNLSLSELGAFPKMSYPRVIWAGIKQEEILVNIAKLLEKGLLSLGIPKEERAFSSHITIGRVRSSKNRAQLIKLLEDARLKELLKDKTFRVDKITLYKSTLTPQGPIYEALHEANLR